ncbi:class I SAM-dependent methyltransferase [Nocardia neocaledoniensis]|uniref:class I SAM-dependent methyltransferase n=1 Tax=Nocardia neocaledoniensis TaxID=236511 RepID=UPI0024546B61|nr:class I SAM-dependent methyltransferase [Nocardia neocaledoniensis]
MPDERGDSPETELFDYDAELRLHNARLRAAARVGAGDRVLDIGCGTGLTTREAARAAVGGSALGVDISAPMLAKARELSAAEQLSNVAFELADAQVHRFAPESFDLCVSRFGSMFFDDPVAAFTNIGQALRPGARLVLLVWREYERNEWASGLMPIRPAKPADGPGPFALADPDRTENILTAAGFTDVAFDEVHEPVYFGADPAAALANLLRLQGFKEMFADLDVEAAQAARAKLRAALTDHVTETGVYFDSRAWIVTACRP